jgi:CheY-like chemotaxis protein
VKPVLYVEDEPDDVLFMHHAWEMAEISNPLVAVKDGRQAIDYLAGEGAYTDRQRNPLPCLVLLDLNMPGKSGFDVLHWIRQQPDLKSLRVVIISGSDQETDIAAAQSLGVIDYIIKPTAINRLLEIVREKHKFWLPNDTS